MDGNIKYLNEYFLFKSKQLGIVERNFDLGGKNTITKEIIKSKEISVIVPILDENNIILVDQYRFGVKKNLLELPAGTIENEEKPIDCAKRELKEETGYIAQNLDRITSFYTSPGINTEHVHCYKATNLIKTESKLEYDEILSPMIINKNKILNMITNENIIDAKSIIGLLLNLLLEKEKTL